MALRITDECVECCACLVACPHQAIRWIREGEGPFRITVLPSACTHCWLYDPRPRCVEACPVDGIVLDSAHPVPPVWLIRGEIERLLSTAGPVVIGHTIRRIRRELWTWLGDMAGAESPEIDVGAVRNFDDALRLLEGEFTPAEGQSAG